jgi:hypothetical protein
VSERRCADDDARCPGVEEPLGVRGRAHAAGGLDLGRRCGGREPPDEPGAWTSRARSVQVDDVHETRPGRDQALHERLGVVLLQDDAVEVTSLEPDRGLSEEIDSRDHLESSALLVLAC